MAWSIRIKTGIFKTEEYLITIQNQTISLTPKAGGMEKFEFTDSDIKTLTIIKKNMDGCELELNTVSGVYLCVLSRDADINQLFGTLSKVFRKKLSVV